MKKVVLVMCLVGGVLIPLGCFSGREKAVSFIVETIQNNNFNKSEFTKISNYQLIETELNPPSLTDTEIENYLHNHQ